MTSLHERSVCMMKFAYMYAPLGHAYHTNSSCYAYAKIITFVTTALHFLIRFFDYK